jgi:tRNA U34 2-thiouridine synthase MnmA/TrmU
MRDVALRCYAEMRAAGYGAVGEFHYVHHRPDGTPYEEPNEMALAVVDAARDALPAIRAAAPEGLELFARVRSTRPQAPAVLRWTRDGAEVELLDGELGVSPGQACVLYEGAGGQTRVLGGGWIDRTTSAVFHAGRTSAKALALGS